MLALSVAASAFLSLSGTSYFYMHPLLLPVFSALSLLLFLIILRKTSPVSTGVKLVLTIVYSLLANLIHVLLLLPGLTGDLAYHLAIERTWDIFGTHYMLLWPLDTYVSQIQGIFNRLYIFQRGTAQYGLVVALTKMLNADLFWINALLIGLLWSIFVPIIAFKVSKTMNTSDRTSLLTGIMTANLPILILYSWKSAGNVFGFFFFFAATYFALRSFSKNSWRKYILLALLASTLAMLSHPMTGFVAFSLIPFAFGIRNYYSKRTLSSKTAWLILSVCFAAVVFSLPVTSVLLQVVYPTYSRFSLQKIFSIDVYHLIFAEYADYDTVTALMYGAITGLSIIGMVAFRTDEKEKAARFFLIFTFLGLVLQHRVFYYFIENPLFGLSRLYALQPFVIIPFAAMVIDHLLQSQKPSISEVGGSNPSPEQKFRIKFTTKEALATILVCIGLSGLFVQGHVASFQADAIDREPFGIVSPFSTEAVTLIHEEFLRNHERYVVVSDLITENAGLMFRGRSNVDELYLESVQNRQLYTRSLEQRSAESLLEAASVNNASIVYLTVAKYSVRMYLGPLVSFEEIVDALSQTLEKIIHLGDDERQIVVFRLRVARKPYSGIGPSVNVLADSQQFQLNTTYSYMLLDNVEYSLTLGGSTNYNITDWPIQWSYESISPVPSSKIINADARISFTGSPDLNYTVRWTANEFFPNVLWKDDSFLQGWIFTGRYTLSNRSLTTDGDIAKDSLAGKPNDWANYQKEIPSLGNCSRLLMRVKGELNAKFMVQIWEDFKTGWEGRAFVSGWTKTSTDFTTYSYQLPSDRVLAFVWLSVMTTDGSPTTIYCDYIMITG